MSSEPQRPDLQRPDFQHADPRRAALQRPGPQRPEAQRPEAQRSEAQRSGDRQAGGSAEARRPLTTPTQAWPAITSPTLNAPIVAGFDTGAKRRRSGPVVWAAVTVGVVVLILIGVVVFALVA